MDIVIEGRVAGSVKSIQLLDRVGTMEFDWVITDKAIARRLKAGETFEVSVQVTPITLSLRK